MALYPFIISSYTYWCSASIYFKSLNYFEKFIMLLCLNIYGKGKSEEYTFTLPFLYNYYITLSVLDIELTKLNIFQPVAYDVRIGPVFLMTVSTLI